MREHVINSLNNFISGWYIDPAVCDNIVTYFNSNKDKAEEGNFIDSSGNYLIKKDLKESLDLSLPDVHDKEFDYIAAPYLNSLQNVLNLYIEKYAFCNDGTPFKITYAPNIQYYPPSGGFKFWHCERSGENNVTTTRHLVYMTFLNDVSNGGGTEFFYQNVKVKAEKGLTLIWPVDWTHTHRGEVSNTEEKYIITGWYNFI